MAMEKQTSTAAPVEMLVMPLQVWRKMTPEEYATQHRVLGRHTAVSQEIVAGCHEVWVFLGPTFREVDELLRCPERETAERQPEPAVAPDL